MIKVNNKEFEFQEGMTVAEALKLAGKGIDQMSIVVVDGQVLFNWDLNITIVTDNKKISVIRMISGG
ncbi:MoaD/ThiS family protein [Clostridium sp.]|uniref:MoaD/ThiS family protein n=1 Tax=Clostridium sp. TaxID=1506 RepID=UPI0025C70F3E|nr:MoaD/ThiS family protein [Clostridium sp.]